MNIRESLIIVRNIHYKCFLIGLFFLIIAAALYYPCKCVVMNLYHTNLAIRWEVYTVMWAFFIGLIKTILIFLFLVPALAIHWVSYKYNKTHPD